MYPMIGLFNLLCVGGMVGLYFIHQRGGWQRKADVALGVLNLAGAYFNLVP